MKLKSIQKRVVVVVCLSVLVTLALAAQDKYSLKVPGGLAFSEFKGYEDWAVIASHHTDELLEAIIGNPVAMEAFRAGIPANGKPFPDGSKMAKLMWNSKKNLVSPHYVKVPGAMVGVEFMVKDAKRFPDSGGWGYAVFYTDAASGKYRPGTLNDIPSQGNDAKCGLLAIRSWRRGTSSSRNWGSANRMPAQTRNSFPVVDLDGSCRTSRLADCESNALCAVAG